MNILFIGDVVSANAVDVVRQVLQSIKKETRLDLVIANGENVHNRNGITRQLFESLQEAGVDVITLGNHAWDQSQIYQFIDETERVVRPFNYPPETPGRGYVVVDAAYRQVAVLVAMGNVFISDLPSPFLAIGEIVDALHAQGVRHIIVDMHAEASAEKMALAHFLDGKVSAVLGTHTHVPTADERILPKGTAYQTDVGMTGSYHSVIGMEVEVSVRRFVTQRRIRYEQADAPPYVFNATLVTLDDKGKATAIQRIERMIEQ